MKSLVLTIWIAIVSSLLLYFAPIIKANSVIFSDDFSDQDLSNWQIIHNTGENRWGVCLDNASPTKIRTENDFLDLSIDGTPCLLFISPQAVNLENKNYFSTQFNYLLKESVAMERYIIVDWFDFDNWRRFKIIENQIVFQKKEHGELSTLNATSFSFETDKLYSFKTEVSQEHIVLKIDEQTVFSIQDTRVYPSANYKTGIMAGAENIYRNINLFDNFSISTVELDNVLLPLKVFKQHDLLWADDEYDTATNWSTIPTIKRWGCALSSASMILNYHQIDILPDGQPLTPLSLNNWLTTQPDGYVGEGLVNWLAVSRLTKKISDLKGTPKLEYSLVVDDSLQASIEQHKKDLPTILQIDGHFLVSNGFIASEDDLIITDPAYPYEYFSEHQTDLLSTRIFTPSHTDLSYIMVIANNDSKLEFYNESGEPVDSTSIVESINSQNEKTEVSKIYQIEKPVSGTYKIKVTANENTDLKFYTYDTQGEVSIFTKHLSDPTVDLYLDLEFDKSFTDNNKLITAKTTWYDFSNLISNFYQNEDALTIKFFDALLKISTYAINHPEIEIQKRYIRFLFNLTTSYQGLDKGIQAEIIKVLNLLKDSI